MVQDTAFDALPPRVEPGEGLSRPNTHVPGRIVNGTVRGVEGPGTGMSGLSRALDGSDRGLGGAGRGLGGAGRGLGGAGGATGTPGTVSNRALAMPPPGFPVEGWQPQGALPCETT